MLILAGGDACRALSGEYNVVRIPVLRYAMGKGGRRSKRATIRRSLPGVLDLKLRGPTIGMVMKIFEDFRPDVVVSDSEPWTHRAAEKLAIPRISFDHFAVLAECDWPMSTQQKLICRVEAKMYHVLIGRPQRYVIASFYAPPPRHEGVRVVGPVLRAAVCDARPTRGEHLLVYLSNGDHHFTPQIEQALADADCPVYVYGTSNDGSRGNLTFRPHSNQAFVADLADCRAVFATAGNQLISEAIHFRKPMLLMPEDSLEQQLNAETIQRLGFGLHVRRQRLTGDILGEFLAGRDGYVEQLRRQPPANPH